MANGFNQSQLRNQVRAAQRKLQTEIDRVNRENQRRVDAYNRASRRQVDAYNKEVQRVNTHNRKVDAQNRSTIAAMNRQLRAGSTGPRYTQEERALADQIRQRAAQFPERDWDTFLSYARIDGSEVGQQLRDELHERGVSVWFDEIAIVPGRSQALQMDRGLRSARCGVALLTPAYLAGRFWTERELGALLHKRTLIPVLHNVSFSEVAEYSGILPDLAGFETGRDSVDVIADKIAVALLADADES